MSTLPPEKASPFHEPDKQPDTHVVGGDPPPDTGKDTASEIKSEVALRIDLLGKLIIPPTSP